MKSHLLIALLILTSCGKDSQKSATPVPEQETPASPKAPNDKETADETCRGETCAPVPAAPVTPPNPPVTPGGVDQPRIPDGLVIFKAADHCVAKASGAFAECQPIPRADVEVKFDLDKVSETDSKIVNSNLSFLSTIRYNYFCSGRQDATFLVFGTTQTPIIHGTGEVVFSTALQNDKQVELKRDGRSFSTVSSTCSIVVTGRKTVLTEESITQLKKAYEQADTLEKSSIKSWLVKEALRLKDTGSSDYDAIIESLPASR